MLIDALLHFGTYDFGTESVTNRNEGNYLSIGGKNFL